MRRALTGIVPVEILNRKEKAFVSRTHLLGISKDGSRLMEEDTNPLICSLDIVDSQRMWDALRRAGHADDVPIIALMRTVQIERWLRTQQALGHLEELTIPKMAARTL